ncbi:HD-GYP domain-containing protein [Agrobacterium rosae]|uniref:Cyclic di-GMP phosphodiesterase response regulator RpfG n=1 Tax=Agrobacterium rosae TaxID=1972867 RepID=A0A1R3U2K4_9HYPH|nr:HD-GYP domain-containing protein [Agrobacterium rosae]SCX35591.1 Cyclic di-GMP phosphodiesterase response regulator RpfG [Agrobacterium rosae]
MLKRIKPTQVRLGMFIEAVDGEWERQPFWRSRFLLDNPDDVMTLKASGVKGVIINTDGGTDLVSAVAGGRRHAVSKAQLTRALEMIEHSKPMIKTMFDDVRMGNSVPIDTATTVVEHIAECMTDSSRALIAVTRLKSRDEYTFLHSIAVTALMVHFGRSIEIGEQLSQTLAMGGLLHDVGKVKIPLDILNKAGPLSDEEMAQMRQHPQRGYDLLSRQADMPDAVLDICRHHHERPDGRGYPQGLAGKQISVPVRIASICDVYDALTSKRPYKKAWTPAQAAEFMAAQKGQFDRPLLKRFFRCLSH